MSVKTAVSVIIGAELGGSFRGAFSTAQKQLGSLGKAIKGLNTTSENAKAFKALGRATVDAKREWKDAEAHVASLARAIRTTDAPSKAMLANFSAAKKEAGLAKSAYRQNRTALSEMSSSLKAAGVDTRNLTAEQTRLGKSLETLQRRQTALTKIENAKQANMSARANYRSQMMDGVALGASLYAVVRPAVDFELAMAKVGAITSEAADSDGFQKLTSLARELGRTTQYTASQAAEAMQFLAMTGFNTEQILAATPAALNLAIAGNMDLGRTADIASNILTGFNISANETVRVTDVLAQVARNTNVNVEQLGESMKYIAPAASAVGGTLEETAALVGILGDAGIQGSMAGTTLRAAYLRLAAPAKAGDAALQRLGNAMGISTEQMPEMAKEAALAQAQLNGMGVEIFDSEGKMRSMVDIMRQLSVALKDATDEEKLSSMKAIFGMTAASGALALLRHVETGRLDEIMEKVGQSTGAAEEMAERLKNTTRGAFLEFVSAIESVGISIGATLLPAFSSMARGAATVAGHISALSERFPVMTKYIGLAVAGLISAKIAGIALGYGFTFLKGGVLSVMGIFIKARTAFTLAKLAMCGLIPMIKAVGLAFVANPIGLAITAIVAGITLLVVKWDKVKNIFNQAKDWLSDSWVGKAWNWAVGDSKTERPEVGSTVADNFSPAIMGATELPRSSVSTSTNSSSVSISAPISINAAPGMNANDIARAITLELDNREQSAARRARGVNYD